MRLVCAVNDPCPIPTDDWLTAERALELLLKRFRCSEGRAERLLDDAIMSREVRLEHYGARISPEEAAAIRAPIQRDSFSMLSAAKVRISGSDLIAWTLTQNPVAIPGRRYATDDDLVVEGVNGIRAGKWANANKAATDLAPRAQGNADAAADRLRRKIRTALGT